MKLKIFKPGLFILTLLALGNPVFAQDTTAVPGRTETCNANTKVSAKHAKALNLNLNINMKHLEKTLNKLNVSLKDDLDLDMVGPEITENFSVLGKDFHVNINNTASENADEHDVAQDRVKSYSKSYPADANDKLQIENKYGKVIVNTWNKNEFKVDVQIKGYSSDDDAAQKMVDAISISDSKNGDVVSFKTNFGSNNGSNSIWKLFSNMNNNHKVEVNYTVYMPAKNALDIDNKYGAIVVPDLDGKVTINSGYGSFEAKSLTHAGNDIRVRYGSASIESLSSADLDVGYGSLDLGSADKLNANVSYSSAKIAKIKSSATINAHYAGGIEIGELDKNFTDFTVNASYSGIKVGLNKATNADFDVTVHYGGFDYNDMPIEITQKSPSDSERGFHPTQNYKGRIGKGGERTINIRSSYGGVKFE